MTKVKCTVNCSFCLLRANDGDWNARSSEKDIFVVNGQWILSGAYIFLQLKHRFYLTV